MFDRLRSTDRTRLAGLATLLLVAAGLISRGAPAGELTERITLWSSEAETPSSASAQSASRQPGERATLYRLPAPSVVSTHSPAGMLIENHFVAKAEPVSGPVMTEPIVTEQVVAERVTSTPGNAVESDSFPKPPSINDVSNTAKVGSAPPRLTRQTIPTVDLYAGDPHTKFVDTLSAAAPPPPPMVGGKRLPRAVSTVESVAAANRATKRQTRSVAAAGQRESQQWFIEEDWSLRDREAEAVSQAITTPELEVTPIVDYRDRAQERVEAIDSDADQSQKPAQVAALPPAPGLPNTPTVAQMNDHVVPAMHKAYSLARRGALYAARGEFLDVLQRIAQAKDAQYGTNQHARALADGLRALEEADDFMPAGVQLEADLDMRALARSHRTTILHSAATGVLPHDAVARYHAYAQQQIAQAVAGEPTGSMVLYGLGKVHSSFGGSADHDLQSLRKSMTMYQAALAAHPGNHLAANELGVLLTQNGHHVEAIALFQRAIQASPTATAYQNLAVVQRKLGDGQRAAANEREAQRLAHWERSVGAISQRMGVQWVSPEQMARLAPPASRPAVQVAAAAPLPRPVPIQPPQHTASKFKWPWQRDEQPERVAEVPPQRIARPIFTPHRGPQSHPRMDPIESNTIWR